MTATVSVALIVKDEAETLPRCLDSLAGAVDEIVVVDTGSTDATRAVARRYTDRILDFAWRRDFAAARQFAFDHARGDWVAWVDADDVVLNAGRIRPMVAAAPADVGGFYWRYVAARDACGRARFEYWRERCVRNDGGFRWMGRVHEVLVAEPPRPLVRRTGVVVEHHPRPARPAGDRRRNLEILEAELAAAGGAPAPRLLFYLARECADLGESDRAIETFERYLAVATWDEEAYCALLRVADLHRTAGRYADALDADRRATRLCPARPEAYFALARTSYFLGLWDEVIRWSDAGRGLPAPDTLLFADPMDGRVGWIIYYTNALFRLGRVRAALDWTRTALMRSPDAPWHRENALFFSGVLHGDSSAHRSAPAEPAARRAIHGS